MDTKTLSVIMPVFNGQDYLADAIESIINQTFVDFNLLIIDDYSTDHSSEIALRYSQIDNRIKLIPNSKQKGLFGSLNTGLDMSKSEFVARADADDINTKNRFELQLTFLKQHPHVGIVGGAYKLFGLGLHKTVAHPKSSLVIAWRFISNTYFCHPSVMFRSSVLKTVGHYPETACEDFAFFSRIIHEHMGSNINSVLVHYRQHSNNYSTVQRINIEASVKKTFDFNYKFYAGVANGSDIFYTFHAKKILPIKHIGQVLHTSMLIAKKIIKDYKTPFFSLPVLQLYLIIAYDIAVAVFVYGYRKIKHGS